MELQQMRYVVAVAQERSFTRAAERCFVVQSALSHQIKALEKELGFELFARTSRRVEVTAAGEAFVAGALATLEAAERTITNAAAARGEIRGSLSIGVIPTVTAVDVPAELSTFHRTHPSVRITVKGGSSDEFMNAISTGDLDVAVLGLPEATLPTNVDHRALSRQRLVAVVARTHPLAGRKRLRLKDIADETFVDFPTTSSGRAQSDLAFRAAGLRRDVAFESSTTDFFFDLITHDLVIALLSPDVVPDHEDLRTIQVVDGPTRVEYLAWSDFNPTPAARAFVEQIAPPGS